MRALAVAILALAAGCSGVTAPGGPSGQSLQSDGASADASGTQLTFTPQTDAAATGSVTLEAGGTISATAADGTTFELLVPAEAVAEDTEITMTPLSDVGGLEASAVHAVQLEPEGLEFYELVRLTITPASEIPVADQMLFEAAGDGSDAGLAMLDPTSADIVLLLEHFSAGGVASVTPQQLATFTEKSADNAERRITNEVRRLQGQDRERQLLEGIDELSPELQAELDRLAAEYQREVVDKRKQAAETSCEGLSTYVRTVVTFERQRAQLAASEAAEAASQERITNALNEMTARYEECEKEAIAACKKAKDPAILIRFWLANERPADKARAEKECKPEGFALDLTGSDIPLRTPGIGTDSTIDVVGQVRGCPIADDVWVFSGETTATNSSGNAAPSTENLLDLLGNQSPDAFTVVLSPFETAEQHTAITPSDFDESFLTVTDAMGTPRVVFTLYNGLGERVGDFGLDAVAAEPSCEAVTP